mgnify:CR=1 FL=1
MHFVTPPTFLAGLLGHPVGHSLSPVLHTWAFAQARITGTYLSWDIVPQRVDAFMLAVRTLPIHGLSVTLPHKRRIIPYVDRISEAARNVGAVNTLYWDGDRLCAENTDVQGIVRPLQDRGLCPQRTMILGAGGAALAAVQAMRQVGCGRIQVAARDRSKARQIFDSKDVDCVSWEQRWQETPDLLINTTPLGMSGPLEQASPWTDTGLAVIPWVFDLVYTPRQTLLLQQAEKAGCGTISGLEMFVHQGMGQSLLWTGHDFDPQEAMHLLSPLLPASPSQGT